MPIGGLNLGFQDPLKNLGQSMQSSFQQPQTTQPQLFTPMNQGSQTNQNQFSLPTQSTSQLNFSNPQLDSEVQSMVQKYSGNQQPQQSQQGVQLPPSLQGNQQNQVQGQPGDVNYGGLLNPSQVSQPTIDTTTQTTQQPDQTATITPSSTTQRLFPQIPQEDEQKIIDYARQNLSSLPQDQAMQIVNDLVQKRQQALQQQGGGTFLEGLKQGVQGTVGKLVGGAAAIGGAAGLATLGSNMAKGFGGGTTPFNPQTYVQESTPEEAKIIGDFLKIPQNQRDNLTNILQTFKKYVQPSNTYAQLKQNFSNTAQDVINQRNPLLQQYNTQHDDSYLQPLKDYINELGKDPHNTQEVAKAQQILDTEQNWFNDQQSKGGIDTMALEQRKESLNKRLSNFLDKDPSSLSASEKVEQQSLNNIRSGMMQEINKIADGTADAGKIKQLNGDYGALQDILHYVGKQANIMKGKQVPSSFIQFMQGATQKLEGIPLVGPLAASPISKWLPGADKAVQNQSQLASFTKNLSQKAQTQGLQASELKNIFNNMAKDAPGMAEKGLDLLKNAPKDINAFVLDPIGAPSLLQYVPGTIGRSFKEYLQTSPVGLAMRGLDSLGMSKEDLNAELAKSNAAKKDLSDQIMAGKVKEKDVPEDVLNAIGRH